MKTPIFRRLVPVLALAGVPVLTVAACGTSASNSPTNDGGTAEGSSCTPGRQVSCPCAGGGQGIQVCNEDGTGYGPYGCGDAAMVEGGSNDATLEGGHDTGSDTGSSGDGPCSCVEGGGDSGGAWDAPADHVVSDVVNDVANLDAEAGPPGGTLNWAERFGVTGDTDVTSLALDPTNGDVVIAGNFTGSTNVGGGVVSGGDAGGGGFLARFDSSGTYKWAHVFTSSGAANPVAVAVDGAGNVLVGGGLAGTADFGGGAVTATGNDDIYLAKFTSAGSYIWAEHFGTASTFSFFRRAVFDPAGDLYVVGEPPHVAASLDVGCGAMPAGSTEFVSEYNSSGACTWSKGFGTYSSSTYTQSEVLALDPTGNVLVAGGFYGTIDFGTGSMTAPGIGMDVFIQEFNSTGSVLWAKSFGVGASVAQATGIGADGSGDLLLDGTFSQTLDLGCGTLTESGQTGAGDIFTAKLDGTGTCIWSNSYGDPNEQLGGPLAVDGSGNPAITGGFTGVLDFGIGAMNGASNGSMYLVKFSNAGTYQWAYAGGPPASSASNSGGIGIGANGAVVVTAGTFQGGVLSLSGNQLSAVSQQDTYLASFIR